MKKFVLGLILLGSLILGGCMNVESLVGYKILPIEQLNTDTAIIKNTDTIYGWETEEIREQLWVSQESDILYTRLGIKKINDKNINKINYLAQFSFEASYASSGITTIKKIVYNIDGKIFTIEINSVDNSVSHDNRFVLKRIHLNENVSKEFVEALSNAKEIKSRIYTLNGYTNLDNVYFDDRNPYPDFLPHYKLFQDSLKIILGNR